MAADNKTTAEDKAAADKAAADKAASDRSKSDREKAASEPRFGTKADGRQVPAGQLETLGGAVSAKSETRDELGAERRGELGTSALTVHRENLKRDARDNPGGSAEELGQLHDDVMDKQRAVDDAVRARDSARDAYDHAAARSAAASERSHESQVADYLKAANKQREAAIARAAASPQPAGYSVDQAKTSR